MLSIKSMGLALIAAIVFLTSTSIFSQQEDIKQKKTPEERAGNISSRMQKKLELTDEQKQSVHDALLEAFKQRGTDRELYKDDKAARKQAAKTRFEKLDTRFKEILTQEQYKKFDVHKQKKMEKRKMKIKNKMKHKNKLKG
jgi:Spy/CpxP family protein refolding chaperone